MSYEKSILLKNPIFKHKPLILERGSLLEQRITPRKRASKAERILMMLLTAYGLFLFWFHVLQFVGVIR